MYSYNPYYYEYLAHHGVKGMRWGIRRYQPYTHGQKGIFKNLKKSYKKGVRSLKKQAKSYEKEGDTLASEGVKSQIKDLKREYKEQRRDYKDQFDAENYDTFRERVANTGSEKMVQKFREDLDANQLAMAVRRLQANKDLEKLKLRDVEAEVKRAEKMAKMDVIAKGASTVSSVAGAISSGAKAFTDVKNAFGGKSKYQKELDRIKLEKDQADANISKYKAEEQMLRNNKLRNDPSYVDTKGYSKEKLDAISKLAGNTPVKDIKKQNTTENVVGSTSGSYHIKDIPKTVKTETKTMVDTKLDNQSYKYTKLDSDIAKWATSDSTKNAIIAAYANQTNDALNKYNTKGSSASVALKNEGSNKTLNDSVSRRLRDGKIDSNDLLTFAEANGYNDYTTASCMVEYYGKNRPKAGSYDDAAYQASMAYLDSIKKK